MARLKKLWAQIKRLLHFAKTDRDSVIKEYLEKAK
jgi:hypothetical protein